MHWLEEQLRTIPLPEVIIHLGAGPCRELPLWSQTGAGRIVLVEPNPELLVELRQRASQYANIEVIAAAIADNSGRGTLRLFNFPLLSSLREPTGLYQSLPGLHQIGSATVDLLALEDLVIQLGVDKDSNNWLIIDTPAEEGTVVEQLRRRGRLHEFSRIFLSAGCEPLYEGAKGVNELLAVLESEGFEPAGTADQSDVDWPRHHLALNRMAVACRRLTQELEEKEALLCRESERANELAIELAALESQAAAQQASYAERIEELESLWSEAEQARNHLDEQHKMRLSEVRNAHQEELQALQQQLADAEEARRVELESSRQELVTQQASSAERIDQLENVLTDRTGQVEQLVTELESAKDEVNELKQTRDSIQETNDSQKEQIGSLISQLKSAHEQLSQFQTQFEKARSDLSLALRLQMLRENDLNELQARYGEVLAIKDEQQDLLAQLHHRLSRAAEYLQLVHSESKDQRLPDELLEALAGKGGQPD